MKRQLHGSFIAPPLLTLQLLNHLVQHGIGADAL
jgi:hypothetical protein